MDIAVNILKWELQDALASGEQEIAKQLRAAIMLLNRNLFHQKIMGADPNNSFYNAA